MPSPSALHPFDLQRALAGAKVVTRAGVEVIGLRRHTEARLCGKITRVEGALYWWPSGKFNTEGDHLYDLFMVESDPYAAFKQALAAGKRLECNDGSDERPWWMRCESPTWTIPPERYRIAK